MNEYGPFPISATPEILELIERIISINEQIVHQNKLIVQTLTIPAMIVKRSEP